MRNRDDEHRLITEAGARAIYERFQGLMEGGGDLSINIRAWWRGTLQWARNRVYLADDRRDIQIGVTRSRKYGNKIVLQGVAIMNQIDDASITAALRYVECDLRRGPPGKSIETIRRSPRPPLPYPDTPVWSAATYNVTPEQRARLAQQLVEGAESHEMLSAGTISMRVYEEQSLGVDARLNPELLFSGEPPQGTGKSRTARDVGYRRHSESQCSMTVRHPKGLGSGWAGLSSYDWSAIDSEKLSVIALEKCLMSLNPVAIEPGRYTVILEPQAVNAFAERLLLPMARLNQENKNRPGVYSLDYDPTLDMRMTKLGLQIIDERISIKSDPMDPRLGHVSELGLEPVTWVDRGVLTTMVYDRDRYAVDALREGSAALGKDAFFMTGGTVSRDEMIETTKRGLIVTRFSSVAPVSAGLSLLMTGVTRDGLWLVENGKISKAVKNMRFTDSPLFVFNQIEQLGVPEPVFEPSDRHLRPRMVPSLKSRDFAFTATIDAV